MGPLPDARFPESFILHVGLPSPKTSVLLWMSTDDQIGNQNSRFHFCPSLQVHRGHRLPPRQSTRHFGSKLLFKRPSWSPFSGLGEGSGSGLGHTAGLRRTPQAFQWPTASACWKGCCLQEDIKKRTGRRGSHWYQATTRLGPCLCLHR